MRPLQQVTLSVLLLGLPACRLPFTQPKAPIPAGLVWREQSSGPGSNEASWTMVDVTEGGKQADAHLLEFADKTRILVDSGFTGNKILPYLASRGIRHLDAVLISHPHKDHYGGIRPLLSAGVKIGTVWMNFPDRGDCDSEKPWGCDWEDLQGLASFLKSYDVALKPARPGDSVYRSPTDSLTVLYAFEHATHPDAPGKLDINDSSVICRLEHTSPNGKRSRALFTGDLNQTVGAYLAQHGKDLEADLLKVPHHGTETVAPNLFFDRVSPKAALVPAPHDLWISDRSKRVRDYFVARKKIPTYVSGEDGDVKVVFNAGGFEISTARPHPPSQVTP